MDLQTQISLDVIISVVGGVVGAVGAYVKLKSKLDLLSAEFISIEKELTDIKERKKDMNTSLHKRIDDIRDEFSTLQKEVNQGHQKLETNMAQMELRIVKEIQSMVEKITTK